ncbi:hypothetical protein [Curtobacterium sp. MCBD17_040]|uniref:hypothetical protein n=1 Tax=Curtobacterium sp. MCBD17_040 TaxID=2175674 RepID=UPI000DA8793D|nr:hypothetical protein [Curtobacterium sp. MCBD17_040]WIB65550.1 hypothetical protein DEI94_19440 [Curtobacterium sp. MCBD17_040]
MRRRLRKAVGGDHLVLVQRKTERGVFYTGFVLALGRKWVLLARTIDGGLFNGYIAFRLTDIASVRPDSTFESRAARLRPEWPPSFPRTLDTVNLDTTAGALRTIPANGELVGVQSNHRYDALWIGVIHAVTRHWVYLHEVRPDATWHDHAAGRRLRRLTVIETDGHYIRGIRSVADSEPPLAEG